MSFFSNFINPAFFFYHMSGSMTCEESLIKLGVFKSKFESKFVAPFEAEWLRAITSVKRLGWKLLTSFRSYLYGNRENERISSFKYLVIK